MKSAPPIPKRKNVQNTESRPFTALIGKFDLETEEISVLTGLDRRTIVRWAKAEATGGVSPVPAPARHLFDIYLEGYVSERLENLLWFRQVRQGADDYYPVEGEENWKLRCAEVAGKGVRIGPWVTVDPLPEMSVGIRFCRARLVVAETAIREGLSSEIEHRRVLKISGNYRLIVDDYARKFPEKAKRGRKPATDRI